jgi:thiamine-phosphate pyrophosphorylase
MADILLIAPQGSDVAAALARLDARALLLLRADDGYAGWVKSVAPLAQKKGVAVLIEGEPKDVRALDADGLHVTGGPDAISAAVKALRPNFIVGAAGIESRDDAMSFGESGVDYVFFGPISGAIDERTREMARWWAETMEVPAVLSDPQATDASASSEGCEFIGLGEAAWR